MNKKIFVTIILIIMMLSFCSIVKATNETENQVVEEKQEEIIEPKELNEVLVVKAKVISTGEVEDQVVAEEYTNKVQKVKVEVLEGEYKGNVYDTTYILSYDLDNKIVGYELDKGNTVFLQITKAEGEITQMLVQDVVRQNYIIYMIIAFFLLILIVGRKQGLKAIIGLVVTIIAIFGFMLKFIYNGHSPIIVAVITSTIIIAITFAIIGGFKKKTITAAIGTTGGVICAGLMAFLFGVLAKLSGAQEESLYLSMNTQNIAFNFRELLFAGIVISSLGACMDVGMSIASALDELKQKNPDMGWKELFKSGMNIGSDIIGTMVNTLILAYVGGSINLVLLFMVSDMSLVEIMNRETLVADIVSALAGSMGVIFTVPITAIVYSLFNKNKTIYKTKSENKLEGKRTMKI